MALLNPDRINFLYAFSAMFGIGTAVTTVIPGKTEILSSHTKRIHGSTRLTKYLIVAALSLSVPSFLLGTAGTLSIAARAFGGIIGITIFTSIYNNKMGEALPAGEAAVLGKAGLDVSELLPEVLAAFNAADPPAALAAIEGLPKTMIGAVMGVFADANTYSWKYVWIAVAVVVAANAIVACFLKPIKDRMNGHVESALEESDIRHKQMINEQ